MAFPYKHILLIGATAGIGRALANHFVKEDRKVIAVGRRQEKLDEFIQKHGESKASSIAFDITELDKIPAFVAEVTNNFPDLDSIVLNAGMQVPFNFAKPETVSMEKYNSETLLNYTSLVALTHAFLPFFLAKSTPTSIIFTGTNLAIIPAAALPGYSASKAALNVFTLCIREQLRDTNIKVIEISPPPVQTELHDYMSPETGRKLGMPADAFVEQVWGELGKGKDQIVIGTIGDEKTFNEIIDKRRAGAEKLAALMRSHH